MATSVQIRSLIRLLFLILIALLTLSFSVATTTAVNPEVAAGDVDSPLGLTLGWSKTFTPDTIGPGSTSTLVFNFDNFGSPATDMAFVDNLPAGVTIATPASIASTCGGTLDAPDGGGVITFSGGLLGGGQSCQITVNVTSSTPGTHSNLTGNLTSSVGNSGPASDDLTVATDRPGFTKSFSPSTVPLGGKSTLTFTIDNTLNPSLATLLTFTDNLPAGMVVADPANAATTCVASPYTGGILTADPGTDVISYSFGGGSNAGAVAADSTCTVTVDVVSTGSGFLDNTSGELTSTVGFTSLSSGKATAVLEVVTDPLALTKAFTDDPVPPGGTVTLEFTIHNFDRLDAATNITFTDDLNAVLPGLVAVGLPLSNPCGAGSQLTGTGLLTLTNGNLAAEASCTFNVTLQVPAGASIGIYPNTTSSITGDVGGSMETGSPAVDDLFVEPGPLLTKTFTDDPITAGDTVTLEFTVTNTSSTSDATDITFIDELTTFLPFPVSATLPSAGFCGGGASMTIIFLDTERQGLFMTGGSLTAGASCTFSVSIDVPVGVATGIYTNTTEAITATVDGETYAGRPATDTLEVVAAPRLEKFFPDEPAFPGNTTVLEFTIINSEEAPAAATDIAFSDDLDAMISGLTAVGLPLNDVCGAGSQINGTSNLSFTGGSLSIGESCTFSVTLQMPADALPGIYTNTTSNVTATASGLAVTEGPATDELEVGGLTFTKSFADPIFPGDMVDLEFTLINASQTVTMSAISFNDDLNEVLTNLQVVDALPINDVCGSGSQLSGTPTFIILANGILGPGESCVFSVTLQVPVTSAADDYLNRTSNLSANAEGTPITISPASDTLTVLDPVLLTKRFTDDPVESGSTVTLEFTIENIHPTENATNITFSDNLDATLAGLVATGLPASVCGGTFSGTSVLSFSGGALSAGTSCTFSVTLQVPASLLPGAHTNTTSNVTSTLNGGTVTGPPASDVLDIAGLSLAKSFTDDPIVSGDTVTLEFTLINTSSTLTTTEIAFTDNLNNMLSGLAAIGLPANQVCGSGSQIIGTDILSFTGGSLAPGESCTFGITLQVPFTAAGGVYTNTTSAVTADAGGTLITLSPAVDTLMVDELIPFSKRFNSDTTIPFGQPTLTFTITNNHQTENASGITFTDDLNAMLSGLTAIGLPANDICGPGSQISGTGTLTLTGGNLSPGATCTFNVTLQVPGSAAPGVYTNTTSLLSASYSQAVTVNAATDDLEVVTPTHTYIPLVLKDFTLAPDLEIQSITVTATDVEIVIENTGNAAVSNDFWVDLYINPSPAPTSVNQLWSDLSTQGLVWGLTDVTALTPGGTITLTLSHPDYRPDLSAFSGTFSSGAEIYVQVDSAHAITTYGAVLEDHEIVGDPYNNIDNVTVP